MSFVSSLEKGDRKISRAHCISMMTGTWRFEGKTKGPTFCRRMFQMHFLDWKNINFDSNFIGICSQWSNQQYLNIGSHASDRWKAIIWANDGIVYWCKYVFLGLNEFKHWSRVTHICVSELPIIGSDNGLSPGRRQAIIWTNAEYC